MRIIEIMIKTNESRIMRLLLALVFAFTICLKANAAVIPVSDALTREATTTSSSLQFFQLRKSLPSVVEVSGASIAGTLNVTTSTADDAPSTAGGFTPDPSGSVNTNTAWQFPAGLSYAVFAITSGTAVVRVAQPR